MLFLAYVLSPEVQVLPVLQVTVELSTDLSCLQFCSKQKTAFVYFINTCSVCVIDHIISTILAHACAALSDNTCVGVRSL